MARKTLSVTTDLYYTIFDRLSREFQPEHLEIFDDSDAHRNHAQSNGAHHLSIVMHSTQLPASRLAQHKAVYACLADLIPSPIHALQLSLNQKPKE